MNWRHIPHPSYGNYGGAHNTGKHGKLPPIDWMDSGFKIHDSLLSSSHGNKYMEEKADRFLLSYLFFGDTSRLARPIYGRVYRLGCLIIFYAACSF